MARITMDFKLQHGYEPIRSKLCRSATTWMGFLGQRQAALERMGRTHAMVSEWKQRSKTCEATRRCLKELLDALGA